MNRLSYRTVFIAALGVSSALGVTRLYEVARSPGKDIREFWLPLTRAVLDGTPLYQYPAVDAKPPLFLFLNVGAGATGWFIPVMIGLVVVANAITATLLYKYVGERQDFIPGLFAAGLFLAALPLIDGTRIGPRPLALPFLLTAVMARSSVRSGGSIAAAVLMIQYAAFALPVIAWTRIRDSARRYHSVARFTMGGMLVTALVFGLVWALWGRASFVSSIYWTFGVAGDYVMVNPPETVLTFGHLSPLDSPAQWLHSLVHHGTRLWFVLIPAAVGLWTALSENGGDSRYVDDWRIVAGCIGLALCLPLAIRSYDQYWVLPLPFFAAVAGNELVRLVRDLGDLDGGSRPPPAP